MPIQAPQWADYLNCPICSREYGAPPRSPISLGCGHTLCEQCLKHLHRKQCPFDQTAIQAEPEELVVNTALLQLAGYSPPAQPHHPPCIQSLPEKERQAYDVIVRNLEHLAGYLKYYASSTSGVRLSKPMQRKLVTLLQCAITDEEGRARAARAARSLGERTVTELILQHQNPQQLSANLWAAVRARGCQFLGPAMQEEVLKLVLLALEDGSALSRKVLVMFVVQRLEPHFPQASKTSIGHVVQLLYRASCFKVSKRECDSSLMQLKEDFRTYDSLRREHDAQIVQIATEAGLRIAPDQWSALLYGDTAHKSHMQSIIDKLQTPQSFAQSVQELFIALQRTWDPSQLVVMSMHLDRLANIDASPDAECPAFHQLAELLTSVKEVFASLVHYASYRDSNHNHKNNHQDPSSNLANQQLLTVQTPIGPRFKMPAWTTTTYCPGGTTCALHKERNRALTNANQPMINGNYTYLPPIPTMPMPQTILIPPMYQRYPMPQPIAPSQTANQDHNFNVPQIQSLPMNQEMHVSGDYTRLADNAITECVPQRSYAPAIMHNQTPMGINQSGIMQPIRTYYGGYASVVNVQDEGPSNRQYPVPEYLNPQQLNPSPVYQGPPIAGAIAMYPNQEQNVQPIQNMLVAAQHEQPLDVFDENLIRPELLPDFLIDSPKMNRELFRDNFLPAPANTFNYEGRTEMPSSEALFAVQNDRRAVGADRMVALTDQLARSDLNRETNQAEEIFNYEGLTEMPSSEALFAVQNDRRAVGADRMVALTDQLARSDLNREANQAEEIFAQKERRPVGADRMGVITDRLVRRDLNRDANNADENVLEEQLQALKRHIATEF